jgi:hypothetical protein
MDVYRVIRHREITHSDSHSIPLTTDQVIAWRQGSAGDAELAYFNKQMLIHELIRGSLAIKVGTPMKFPHFYEWYD